MKDLYKIRGVPENASDDSIKQSYRKLARELHPDVTGGDKRKTERFKEVNEAYGVLGESAKRKEYDRMRHAPVGADGLPEGFDMDAFARAFGGHPGGRGRRAAGAEFGDLNDLFGSLFGGAMPRGGPGVRWEVHTPGGGSTHFRRGPEPPRARPPLRHPHLRAEGEHGDVLLDLPLTLAEAAFGAKISVPTLDGPVTVTVPPGTSSGARLRLRGRGQPRAHGGRGDQHCRIEIVIPKAWGTDPEARRLVEELSRRGTPSKVRPF